MSEQAKPIEQLKMQPLPHQERVATKFTKNPSAGGGLIVAHGTGTGKTFTSIYAAHATGKPVVAVVPAALRENYKKELVDSGFTGDAEVISYNELLKRQHDPEFRTRLQDSVVVYDEAHRLGREDSKISSVPKQLPAYKKLLMTGTLFRNHPSEIAPLLSAVSSESSFQSKEKFLDKYITQKKVNPGLLGMLRGAKPGVEEEPKNLDELRDLLKDVVDFYSNTTANMPAMTEEHINVPMSPRQSAAYNAVLAKQPGFAYKLRHGIPPGKDLAKYRAFLTGLRQISNSPNEFAAKAVPDDSAKIVRAADEVQKHHDINPNYRGYSYSTFLKSGLLPMQEELKKRGIAAEIFDGTMDDAARKDLVNRYNKGKVKHLLVSSAGSEGLDLKGTRLIQILEPHWNLAKIHQVRARGIRYKSHDHLPEEERNVHVQHFFADKPQHPVHAFLGMRKEITADATIHTLAHKKEELNKRFMNAISDKPVTEPTA